MNFVKAFKKDVEFTKQYPVGSIISFVDGAHFSKAGARTIFRIDKYITRHKKHYTGKEYDKINMQGISVYFNFQTEHYKKEYTTEDANKWHYVEYDDKLTELMEQFLPCHHKFEDTRLANERELEIFKYVLDNDLRDLRDRY